MHTHTHTHQYMHLPSHVRMLQVCTCARTHTHTHTLTLKSNLILYEVLPKTRLLTEVAWFAQLWGCSLVTQEGQIPLPSRRINQMVLLQLPAMGRANSHVHFYMAFCMGWEETSVYPLVPICLHDPKWWLVSVLQGKYVGVRSSSGQAQR